MSKRYTVTLRVGVAGKNFVLQYTVPLFHMLAMGMPLLVDIMSHSNIAA